MKTFAQTLVLMAAIATTASTLSACQVNGTRTAAGSVKSAGANPGSPGSTTADPGLPGSTPAVTPRFVSNTGPNGTILACTNPHLGVTGSTSQGAAGTLVKRFIVTNHGAHTCKMYGHPGISMYGKQQQGSSQVEATLPGITVSHIPAGFGDLGAPATVVKLAPGGTAVFFVKSSHVPAGNSPCPKADGFAFQPPPATGWNATPLVPYAVEICGDQVSVSAILPPTILN